MSTVYLFILHQISNRNQLTRDDSLINLSFLWCPKKIS